MHGGRENHLSRPCDGGFAIFVHVTSHDPADDACPKPSMDPDAEARRRARAAWPIRRFDLGCEPNEDLSDSTTMEERLGMMWQLALDAWSMSGRPLPDYERADMPIRMVRPSNGEEP